MRPSPITPEPAPERDAEAFARLLGRLAQQSGDRNARAALEEPARPRQTSAAGDGYRNRDRDDRSLTGPAAGRTRGETIRAVSPVRPSAPSRKSSPSGSAPLSYEEALRAHARYRPQPDLPDPLPATAAAASAQKIKPPSPPRAAPGLQVPAAASSKSAASAASQSAAQAKAQTRAPRVPGAARRAEPRPGKSPNSVRAESPGAQANKSRAKTAAPAGASTARAAGTRRSTPRATPAHPPDRPVSDFNFAGTDLEDLDTGQHESGQHESGRNVTGRDIIGHDVAGHRLDEQPSRYHRDVGGDDATGPALTQLPPAGLQLRALMLDQKRSTVSVRLSEEESERLRLRAAESGMSVSAYMRSCVLEADHLRAQVKQALAQMRARTLPLAPEPPQLPAPSGTRKPGAWSRFLLRSATFFLGSWYPARRDV